VGVAPLLLLLWAFDLPIFLAPRAASCGLGSCWFGPKHWARLVQLHEQHHDFNSQTANSLPNSLASFSENPLSQS
jgi:hypothetical protein